MICPQYSFLWCLHPLGKGKSRVGTGLKIVKSYRCACQHSSVRRESARELLESDPRKVRDKLERLALRRVWCLSLQIIAGKNAKGISKMNYNSVMEASMGELMCKMFCLYEKK